MGLTITLGGVDRTSRVQFKSLNITSMIIAEQTTADLEVSTTGGSTWRPLAGNEVIIATSSDGTRHFAGHVLTVTERSPNAADLRYSLSCKDYTWLFDRRMVTTTYESSAASAIVAAIVGSYTTGFSTGGIQVAPSVPQQRLDYVYPSDAIRSIADQIQWHWYIDFNKQVQFFSAISNIAPTTAINFDTEASNYGDLVLSESAQNIKNRIILQGYKKASTVRWNRSFTGDGFTRFFLLGYEPVDTSTGKLAITVGGNAITALFDQIDGSPGESAGTSSQAFVCFSNMGVRFSTSVSAPTSTQTVSVDFNYMLDGGIQYDDGSAQTEMASRSSGDGIHMFMVNDPSLTNLAANDDLALALGSAMTARYGRPTLEGQFTSYLQGWRAGQYFTGVSARRMGGFNQSFYVHQVEKSLVTHPSGGSPTWVHRVHISNSPSPI